MKEVTQQTYYELLEVAAGASLDEIRKAFVRAKATYSPDSPAIQTMFTPEESRQLLLLIEEAYSILSNDSLRQQYDRRMQLVQNTPHPSTTSSSMNSNKTSSQPFHPKVYATPLRGAHMDAVPEGHGTTKFGFYKQDSAMENEITKCENVDGSFLAKIRSYKQISLDQMCQVTRIGRHYLIAVEANDLKALPAPVFVRGFIKQIATELGLNIEKTVNGYMQQFK